MKPIALLLTFSFLGIACFSQPPKFRGEFATNANGLMYSESDMRALRFIVDSLNLRFKTCDLSKLFYSNKQARIYHAQFSGENADALKADINAHLPFDVIVKKYSDRLKYIDTTKLIIQNINKSDGEFTYLSGDPLEGYDYYQGRELDSRKSLTSQSFYEISNGDRNNKTPKLDFYYFPENWKTIVIPHAYARLIQYVDCMIDTTAHVFLTDEYTGGWNGQVREFYYNLESIGDYLDSKMRSHKENNAKKKELTEEQVSYIKNNLRNDPAFRKLLSETIHDYVDHKTAQYQLEDIASDFGLYEEALLMKRSYRVMGSCSQDESPRLHARDIAILSAQAHEWDIFLRAHLDIMNDRFERASDGSYAWGGRKTYLKELEELNLDIVDLILGLTLRANNVADNHYYGTIWRMGWAMTESKNKKVFEQKAIEMMKDYRLDEFNRGLICMLFITYLNHSEKSYQKQCLDEVSQRTDLPDFISKAFINSKKQLTEKK